jgi:hypothetical protein
MAAAIVADRELIERHDDSRVAPGTPMSAVRTGLREKSNRSPPCQNGNWKKASRDRCPETRV